MKLPALPLAALALLLAQLLAQCRHAEPAPAAPVNPLALLPVESQTGAGTFGCLINGKAYTTPFSTFANGEWQAIDRLVVNGALYESGNTTGTSGAISMVLGGNLLSQGLNQFNIIAATNTSPAFTPGMNQFFCFSSAPNNHYYSGKYIKSGKIELTKFDGPARIASGRFAFVLYELGISDTLRVTDGRFDVKF